MASGKVSVFQPSTRGNTMLTVASRTDLWGRDDIKNPERLGPDPLLHTWCRLSYSGCKRSSFSSWMFYFSSTWPEWVFNSLSQQYNLYPGHILLTLHSCSSFQLRSTAGNLPGTFFIWFFSHFAVGIWWLIIVIIASINHIYNPNYVPNPKPILVCAA